jgi:hypothetical protein
MRHSLWGPSDGRDHHSSGRCRMQHIAEEFAVRNRALTSLSFAWRSILFDLTLKWHDFSARIVY